jgi:hypothetical protein
LAEELVYHLSNTIQLPAAHSPAPSPAEASGVPRAKTVATRLSPDELAEVAAARYMLLNLFHATALANGEGRPLLPDSVLKIRDAADARKLAAARKMLQDFFAQDGLDGGRK